MSDVVSTREPSVTLSMSTEELTYLTDGERHLVCVPYSIANLHKMAKDLEIKKCWFHKDHYDVPLTRQKEIEEKCEKVSAKVIVEIVNRKGKRK